ncbi:RDD family protein [Cereibacter changlensis]|uniref:RDD family protein n=1 Tax=Cereibacter changlensis TaxID=402884 RepID=UPI0040337E01
MTQFPPNGSPNSWTADRVDPLPDPVTHAEFYDGVPFRRGLAWIFDMVLIALITAIIVPFTAFTALFFLPFLFLCVGFCYRTVSLTRSSATPGMRLMAVELRNRDGRPLEFGEAFLHTLGYTISIGMVVPQVISVALMMVTARGQGLTDYVLGTVALNRASRY